MYVYTCRLCLYACLSFSYVLTHSPLSPLFSQVLFAPLISFSPKLEMEAMECDCTDGDPILVNMSVCLSAATYVQWKNDARYMLTSLPTKGMFISLCLYLCLCSSITRTLIPPPHTHTGTLSHYTTKHEYTQKGARIADTDSIVYTPDSDSDRGHGSDSFSFMVQLGAVTSKQCVITLVLDDQEEIKKPKAGLFSCLGCSGSKKGPKGDDYDDNECVYMYIRMFLSPPLLPPRPLTFTTHLTFHRLRATGKGSHPPLRVQVGTW